MGRTIASFNFTEKEFKYTVTGASTSCLIPRKYFGGKNYIQRLRRLTKRRYKEERKKILQKHEIPLTEMPDEVLKDKNGWIWLRDLIDYRR